jgi:NADH-quinone oxidoreductase subunit H
VQLVLVVLFLILVERKIIRYISVRKGPNKVTIGGLYQSVADVMKLVFKEVEPNIRSKSGFFFLGPFFSLLFILVRWIKVGVFYYRYIYIYGVVVVFCVMRVQIYVLLVVR